MVRARNNDRDSTDHCDLMFLHYNGVNFLGGSFRQKGPNY